MAVEQIIFYPKDCPIERVVVWSISSEALKTLPEAERHRFASTQQ